MTRNQIEVLREIDYDFEDNPCTKVNFLVDGFRLTISGFVRKGRVMKQIHINGQIGIIWAVNEDSEENKRFAYSRWEYVESAAMRRIKKEYHDKIIAAGGKDNRLEKYEIRTFFFEGKLLKLIRQWISNPLNKSIELLEPKMKLK